MNIFDHLKKTLEENAAKLLLLPSSLIRETKVVEAHLTMMAMLIPVMTKRILVTRSMAIFMMARMIMLTM